MATINDTLAKRQQESASQIGDLYNQQYNSQAAQLKTAYDRNVSDAQVAQAKIAPQYQTQANQLAAQYERNRRNANLSAMSNGLGTGTAVQQAEALNNKYQQNYAGLRANEMQAQTDAGQKITSLGTDYQNQLAQARMEAENKAAAAKVENYNKQNTWYDEQAKTMAGFGDFSAYEKLYGKDAADQMKEVWIIQNPRVALGAGLIDAKKYKEITGENP